MNEKLFYAGLIIVLYVFIIIIDCKTIHKKQFITDKRCYFVPVITIFIMLMLLFLALSPFIKTEEQQLHSAICHGRIDKVKQIMNTKIDVNVITGRRNFTPLMYACWYKKNQIARLLISKYHADVNRRNISGYTALIIASGRGLVDVVKILLENGADVNQGDVHNITPLARATRAKKQNIEIFKLLSKYNARDAYGCTALMCVTFDNNVKVMKILLDNYNDVNVLNNETQTALDIAREKGFKEAEKLLLEYGAKTGKQVLAEKKQITDKQDGK